MTQTGDLQFESTELSSGFLLWQVTMAWQRSIKKELDKLDITYTQFVLLTTLDSLLLQTNIVSQIDIANHSYTDRMMVSKVLRTLEEKKMIQRKDHPTDTRAKIINLSPFGKESLEKAIIVVKEVDNAFFSVLGPYKGVLDLNMKSLWENTME
ncbi:MarR family winged helix-turn-helix transcriptional regulator [Myroides sp. LoEW2-1]|uniref:MarR family winged helix-turn-helix transcriptional regulator n=1 Tax=Myroides sp. LoEW2-1 TaxID=2683192 RepID=UPI001325E16F|nr:MarR family transcriptional regulator [Myroides sp. LoEW2-1]MVX35097.1 MarR family transcriptional regulator [Myroides sp. LoEW2-1]